MLTPDVALIGDEGHAPQVGGARVMRKRIGWKGLEKQKKFGTGRVILVFY